MTSPIHRAALAAAGLFAVPALGAAAPQSLLDAARIVLDCPDPPFQLGLDADGDGALDLLGMGAWPHQGETYLRLYHNDGSANYSTAWDLTVEGYGADIENPLAAGDLDGDGRDDFAVAIGDRVHAFVSNGVGAPTVLPAVDVPVGELGWVVAIVLDDFDDDGRDDLGVLSVHEVHLFRSDPAGGFEPPRTAAIATGHYGLVSGQLDGLEGADLAAGNGSSLIRIPVVGLEPVPLAADSFGGITSSSSLACGDIDGDGDDDLVAFTGHATKSVGTFAVMRQGPAGTFVSEEAVPGGPAARFADVDGDGDLDGVCCGGGGSTGDPGPQKATGASWFRISINDGTGHFAPAWSIQGLGSLRIAAADDLDGDGDVDLAAGRALYRARGPLIADPFPTLPGKPDFYIYPHHEEYQPLRSVDVDGDGDVDLGAGSGTRLRNDGSGAFASEAAIVLDVPEGDYVLSPGIPGDWDGDGDSDVLVRHYPDGEPIGNRVLVNQGGGVLRFGPAAGEVGDYALGSDYAHSTTGDVDGDGDLDLFHTFLHPSYEVHRYLGDGAGSFTKLEPVWQYEAWFELADFDGDGLDDALTYASGQLGWRRAIGGGEHAPQADFGDLSGFDLKEDRIPVVDLDLDGDLDVVAWRFHGEVVVLRNDGAGGFAQETGLIPDIPYHPAAADAQIHACQLDGDGYPDLVVHPVADALRCSAVYLSDGTGQGWGPGSVFATRVGTTLDVDGDGDDDLVGVAVHDSLCFDGVAHGARRQYGASSPGSEGLLPHLGARGPFRAGEVVRVYLSGGAGGAAGVFALGIADASLVDFPVPGATLHLDPFHPATALVPLVLTGAPGEAGVGAWQVDVPIALPMSGFRVLHQAALLDGGAPFGIAVTNALELVYGEL